MNAIARAVAICLCLLVTAGIAQVLKPSKRPSDETDLKLSALVPETFSGWRVDATVVPIAPSPDVQANLDKIYRDILSRTYVNLAGNRIMLTIAYGGDQSDSLKAHRQEVCYRAQGFKIKKLLHDVISFGTLTIPVTRMLAVRNERSEPVTYWFTMGDKVVLSRLDRLLAQIQYGLSGFVPDGMLVRVSSISSDDVGAFKAHEAFVNDFIGSLGKTTVTRFVGNAQ